MRDEVIGGTVLFVFGAATAFLSAKMPLGTFRMAGPGLFPMILGVLLMGLSAAWIVRCFLRATGPVKGLPWPQAATRVAPFVGAMALGVLALNPLGYPLTATLLLLVLFRITDSRNWGWNLLVTLGVGLTSYFVFVRWLQVPLPKGFLGL